MARLRGHKVYLSWILGVWREGTPEKTKQKQVILVGGWTNPFKNISQNGNLPQVEGWKLKNIGNHHPEITVITPHIIPHEP